jgi:hypothetical protein
MEYRMAESVNQTSSSEVLIGFLQERLLHADAEADSDEPFSLLELGS